MLVEACVLEVVEGGCGVAVAVVEVAGLVLMEDSSTAATGTEVDFTAGGLGEAPPFSSSSLVSAPPCVAPCFIFSAAGGAGGIRGGKGFGMSENTLDRSPSEVSLVRVKSTTGF